MVKRRKKEGTGPCSLVNCRVWKILTSMEELASLAATAGAVVWRQKRENMIPRLLLW